MTPPTARPPLTSRVLRTLAGWRSYRRVERVAAAFDSPAHRVRAHVHDRLRDDGRHAGVTLWRPHPRRGMRGPEAVGALTARVCSAGPFRPRTVSCGAPVFHAPLLYQHAPVHVDVYGSAGAAHAQLGRSNLHHS